MINRRVADGNLERFETKNIEIGGIGINFQRTCRVPQGKTNSLPAGLGSFPVYRVKDFKSGVPDNWKEEGYFFPVYEQEAMWFNFSRNNNPKAIIIAAGNINAITGKPFDPSKAKGSNVANGLDVKLEEKQNYVVVPPQPWIDGWKAEDGKVYQFVAAKLGSGETVEEQITGEASAGGIQLITYNPKPGQNLIHETRPKEYITGGDYTANPHVRYRGACRRANVSVASMGLGRGGEINQKIYPDPYGLNVWNEKPESVDLFYMVAASDFKQVTGYEAPPTPVTYKKYQELGFPWFELHDEKLQDSKGSDVFGKLKPVGDAEKSLLDKLKV